MRRSVLILLVSATAATLSAGASTAQPSTAAALSPLHTMRVVRTAISADARARAAFAASRVAAQRESTARWAHVPNVQPHRITGASSPARLLQAGPPPLCDGLRATIVGTEDNDTLVGTPGRDVIAALGGNDVVYGKGQNDVICAGSGDDLVWGGAGNDRIFGQDGNDLLDGGAGNDTIDGGGQQFDGAAFFDESGPVTASLVTGTATGDGSDTFTNVQQLHGGNYTDTFTGDARDNGLFGNGGNDTLFGNDGNDYLSGGTGDDTIDGGAGTYDAVTFWDATGPVTASLATGTSSGGGEGNDTFTNAEVLNGGPGDDALTGDAGDNSLWGEAGNDTLSGGAGNDFVDGGAGNDTMDGGGQQFDAAAFFDETGPVTASLVTGTATGDGYDTFTGVRQLHGGNFADTFTGDANDNGLFGNGGNDTLNGGDGNDNLSGGTGDDTIDGGSGTFDSISFWDATGGVTASLADGTSSGGGEGNDTFTGVEALYGGPGNDTLTGDAGDNWLQGQAGDDTLSGGPGNDVLGPGAGNDTLDGGPGTADQAAYWDASGPITANLASGASGDGNDTYANLEQIQGSPFDDTLTAGPTDAWLFGNDGNDTINGGAGNDFLFGNNGNDTINGGGGDDFLAPGSGTDTLDGGAGSDNAAYWDAGGPITADLALGTASGDGADTFANLEGINGSNYDDTLTGDAGNNGLSGNDGNDTIDGAAGDDSLNGGNGNDTLRGGPGNDYLDGSDGSDSLDGGSDFDTCVGGETYSGCELPPNVGRTNLALHKSVTASSEDPGAPASQAVDGDWFSIWNSDAFPPQWIVIDLGAITSIGEIDLFVAQLPDSVTTHRLYGSADAAGPYVLLQEFSGFTDDHTVLRYYAAAPLALRFIKVETTSSASWVAWREIQVFAPGD